MCSGQNGDKTCKDACDFWPTYPPWQLSRVVRLFPEKRAENCEVSLSCSRIILFEPTHDGVCLCSACVKRWMIVARIPIRVLPATAIQSSARRMVTGWRRIPTLVSLKVKWMASSSIGAPSRRISLEIRPTSATAWTWCVRIIF